MRFFCAIIFLFSLKTISAQIKMDMDSLNYQSESYLYTDPDLSLKISDYVDQNSRDSDLQKEAILNKIEAFFLKKEYSKGINLLQIHFISESDFPTINVRKNILLIKLLNELGFSQQIKELLINAKSELKQVHDTNEKKRFEIQLNFLEAKSLQKDNAKVYETLLSDLQKLENHPAQKNIENTILIALVNEYSTQKNWNKTAHYNSQLAKNGNQSYFYISAQINNAKKYALDKDTQKSLDILLSLKRNKSPFTKISTIEIDQLLSNSYTILEDSDLAMKYDFSYLNNYEIENTNLHRARVQLLDYLTKVKTNSQERQLIQNTRNFWVIAGLLIIVLIFLSLKYYQKLQLKRQNQLLEDVKSSSQEEKNIPFVIPEKTELLILEKLTFFEEHRQYLNPNLSLNSLAKEFNSNTSYLSEIVNKHKNKNFKTYINELRINYIIDKLKNNPEYLSYKISYLADESGFVSRTSFAVIFKSVTGISPSSFIESLKNQPK